MSDSPTELDALSDVDKWRTLAGTAVDRVRFLERRVDHLSSDVDGALHLLASAAASQPTGELRIPFDKLVDVALTEPALEQYRDEARRELVIRARP